MKSTSQLFLALLLLVIFSSCESENSDLVSQKSINTNYDLEYDEDDRNFLFYANFTSGLKQVWITANSSISFEGHKMAGRKDILGTIRYRYRHVNMDAGQVGNSYNSSYVNEDGKVFNNTFHMPSPIHFSTYGNASREKGLKLNWKVARDLGEAGELIVRLYQYDKGSCDVKSLKIKKGQDDLSLKKSLFENIEEDEIGIKICHKTYTRRINAPISGGSFSGTYCTRMQYIGLDD